MNKIKLKCYIKNFDLYSFIKQNYSDKIIDNKDEYTLKCPNCPSSKSAKLSICKDRKIFHCFRCGIRGNLVNFISLYKNCSNKEAINILCNSNLPQINDELVAEILSFFDHENEEKKENSKIIFLPDDYRPLNFYSNDSDCIQYAFKRGIKKEHIELFDIGYSQKLKRIIFPVYENYELVGWQGRDIYNSPIKALTCPGMEKANYIYNYDNVIGKKEAILCEGPIDAIHAYKYNSMAIFGKKISKIQLNLLLKLNLDIIYLGLDEDAGKEKIELANSLYGFIPKIKILSFPNSKDLGDSSEEEIEQYVKKSILYSPSLKNKNNITNSLLFLST